LTVSVVVPDDPEKTLLPEYVPEIVSLPAGAAEEGHEPVPLDNVAMQRVLDPALNVTVPVGVGAPTTVVVTFAE
jgi:hypothetical protein